MKRKTQPLHVRLRSAGLRVAWCVLALGSLAPVAFGAEQSIVDKQQVEAVLPQIARHIEVSMLAWQVPGLAVGIVAGDELVYARGYGVRERGSDQAVDADTLFQIGSTSKAFLGLTEAILVDRGQLAWTDEVGDHLPEFRLADPWATREFQVVDLLAQRSGLPGYTLTNMMFYDYPPEDIIKALRHVEPVTSFRSTYAYQNAFHLVAGKLVARMAGVDRWETFLQSEVLDPLGMSSSSYDAQTMEQSGNRASGHRLEGKEIVVDPWAPFPYNAGGAGNLNSNINDMSRWLRFQINQGEIDGKRLISREALGETHEPRVEITGYRGGPLQSGVGEDLAYATGWSVLSTPQGKLIEHAGGTSGFSSHVAFDPARRFGVVVLSNLAADIGTGLGMPIAKYIADLLQGRSGQDYSGLMLSMAHESQAAKAAALQAPANARAARPLEDYAGAYTSPTLGDVVLKVENGKLGFTLGPRHIPVALEHWSGDVFVSTLSLPAFGPDSYQERKKLTFMAGDDDTIVGFEWVDKEDSSGQPPFVRDQDANRAQ